MAPAIRFINTIAMLSFTLIFHPPAVVLSPPATYDPNTFILRPPSDGSNRHTMFLPLLLSSPTTSLRSAPSSVGNSRRHLQKSDPHRSNARMALHDDLLLNGYYTTRLMIGSPPQRFTLIMDTGSTVTYVPCSTCEQCGKH